MSNRTQAEADAAEQAAFARGDAEETQRVIAALTAAVAALTAEVRELRVTSAVVLHGLAKGGTFANAAEFRDENGHGALFIDAKGRVVPASINADGADYPVAWYYYPAEAR